MHPATILGVVALLSSSAQALVTRTPHAPTTADVTDFKATRNGTHINYSATIQVHSDIPPAKFSHATPGSRVPDTSDMWDSSDPQLYFRFQRVPPAQPGGGEERFRFVLSDVHKTGQTVNLDYFSGVSEWEGKGHGVYTGPGKFVLRV